MSWNLVKIGDVCKTGAGGTPLKSKKEFYDNGTIPWLLSGEVSQGEIFTSKKFITAKGLQNSSAKIFPRNTVLVAMYGATAGQVGILRFEAATNQAVCGIYPNNIFLPEFTYYSMLFRKKELIGKATGNAQPNISQIKIKNTKIPLISLEEQKRIVAILDEAFAGIDTAIANTEKNLANARELFESYLNSVFTQRGEGWYPYKLLELTTKIGSGATPKGGEKSYKTEGISLIRSLNVYDRRFTDRKLAFIDDEQAAKLSNVIVEEGDVLFNITGASVARCCIAPSKYLPARVNQHVSILRPKKDQLSTDFLCYLMTSRIYKDKLLGIGDEGGSTRQAITKTQLQNLKVFLPDSLNKQLEVVEKLNALSSESLRLESIYQQKLNSLKELKQSLLQKAFSGELTAKPDKLIDEAVA